MPPGYTVKPGDTLSDIAGRYYHNAALYPSLWWINKGEIKDPNVIRVGQVLRLSHWHPQTAWLAAAAKKADPPVVRRAGRHVAVSGGRGDGDGLPPGGAYCKPHCWGDGDGDGFELDHPPGQAAVYRAPAHRSGHRSYRAVHAYRAAGSSGGTYHGSDSMQRCIIRAESGGKSQIMNSSGHYGLYQFSSSTWAAHGGSSASFGHASVAEQNRVFRSTVAANGYRDWTPYDGC